MSITRWLKSLAPRRAVVRRTRRSPSAAGRTLHRFEHLEDRRVLATFVVTQSADNGVGSLRWAIIEANANPGADTIGFNIPASDPGFVNVDSHLSDGDDAADAFVIRLQSPLPQLNDSQGGTSIDGRTQGALTGDTNPLGPEIILDGSSLGSRGLHLASDGNQVFGLNIQGFGQSGVLITGDDNWIAGNYIGSDATGTREAGNARSATFWGGVQIDGAGNLIGSNGDGDDDASERNLISGNRGRGIWVNGAGSHHNTVAGNYIGVDVTGAAALGNGNGGVVVQSGAHSNRIGVDGDGAADLAQRNVISGNLGAGVSLFDQANANVVAGNYVGVDATGAAMLGNTGDGVTVTSGAHGNRIGPEGDGAADVAQRNVISGNRRAGISIFNQASANVVAGNYIGISADGDVAMGNGIHGVWIFNAATANIVGGDHDSARNVISGNAQNGVHIGGSGTDGNVLAGNYIGTDASGNAALGNGGRGVAITRASHNVIGGDQASARNVISGNAQHGVEIADPGAEDNILAGNYIGTDTSGNAALGNGGHGVAIARGAAGNVIGGDHETSRNVISGNAQDGVRVEGAGTEGNIVAGNYIGANAYGEAAVGNGANGVLIAGQAAANFIGGDLESARNVISGNAISGVAILNQASENILAGNYIGTNASGDAALGNGSHGVWIFNAAAGNTIGGDHEGAGNVISGNLQNGVHIAGAGTHGNLLAGNLIGTNAEGDAAVGNGRSGVLIGRQAAGTVVGGDHPSARNVISGNTEYGVLITDAQTEQNRMAGNYIGTSAMGIAGPSALGNGLAGIAIRGAGQNLIGGTESGAGNIVSGNRGEGVALYDASSANQILGNQIVWNTRAGVGAFDMATGNVVRGNSIHSNGGLGIDLGGDGVTVNDSLDDDAGPNGRQNFPGIGHVVTGATTRVAGAYHGASNAIFTLDFYANAAVDPSGSGEGERYLGAATITTDASGNASFDVTVAAATSDGESVTATATDADGNTSEFSNRLPHALGGGTYAVDEGGSVTLDASASFDPEGAALIYAWDLDGDGAFDDGVGPSFTFSAADLDGPHAREVRVRVIDVTGLFADAAATIEVENVAPQAFVAGPASALRGETVELALGATDQAAADQAASFSYEIDWNGDGGVDRIVAGMDAVTVSHAFDDAGATTIIVVAVDKDGGRSEPVMLVLDIIQPVLVDVKPDNEQNNVNVKSQGVIPVAIYSTENFDATTIQGESVLLASVAADHFALEDVNRDGALDLILHFRTQDILDAIALDIASGEAELLMLELTGRTSDGADIFGVDAVEFFFPGKGRGKNGNTRGLRD